MRATTTITTYLPTSDDRRIGTTLAQAETRASVSLWVRRGRASMAAKAARFAARYGMDAIGVRTGFALDL